MSSPVRLIPSWYEFNTLYCAGYNIPLYPNCYNTPLVRIRRFMRHIIIIITPVSIFVNSFGDYLYGFLYQRRERRAVRAYDDAAAAVHRYQHA